MKRKLILLIALSLPLLSPAQEVNNVKKIDKGILVDMQEGTLAIFPVADNAIRIRYFQSQNQLPELIFTKEREKVAFELIETTDRLEVKTQKIIASIDKKTGNLAFRNSAGKIFLCETEGSRFLELTQVMGEPCYIARQSFDSPDDEYLFGLGQFQDGHYNLKGITRRLTQVNSQIALPIIFSSRGYGLLWHQYGITDFNPAENSISLTKHDQAGGDQEIVEVTTTSGTQKLARNQSLYTGKFSVPVSGAYSLFLDFGNMENRHFLAIDGKACIDQSNLWLPPTTSTLLNLEAGEHQLEIICRADNEPKLYWENVTPTTTFQSSATQGIDYIVFYGPSADSVIASYRNLTGSAPLFPKWAYGYWQCRERYTSSTQLVETVKKFRERKLPMDVIVQDWQYWGSRGWGVPQFDKENYPEPSVFISDLHNLNAHFNISIWSNPDKNSEIGKAYVADQLFIPGTKWLDYFNPKTREDYWETLKTNMFDFGVDSWWMDAVEPENDALKGETTYLGPGDFYRLTYPLMVSQAVYEGQRKASSEKRVCILTRSAFLGQQRYGIINWSGDIGGTWDSYRRQIVAGLNFTITGLPYWTTDIGGFFRPGSSQYSDEKYHELLIRWFQWGVFNPIFRMHGYQSETEPWQYGSDVENKMRKMLNLRYLLMPYIYSEAFQITLNASTMMRPLIMDFPTDTKAIDQMYEYMFGKAILVAPVTEPGMNSWKVYLPHESNWFNFWTGESTPGGQVLNTEAPLENIPLFVKAGSVLPIGPEVQFAGESNWDELEIRIYPGADGNFTLYEDEGDNYNYENGAYSTIDFSYNDQDHALTIHERKGSFPGMVNTRIFNIVVVRNDHGAGIVSTQNPNKTVTYNGNKIEIKL